MIKITDKTSYYLIVTIYICLLVGFARVFVSEIYAKRCISENSVSACELAMDWHPLEPTHHLNQANVLIRYSGDVTQTNNILESFFAAHRIHPNNPLIHRDSVFTLYKLAQQDPTQLSLAQDYLRFMRLLYPSDVGVMVTVAEAQKKLNLQTDYEETREAIRSLRPDLLEWHQSLR